MESVTALLTAVVVLLTAGLGFLEKVRRDVKEVHVIINSRTDRAEARIDQLTAALAAAGITIPDKPVR